MGYNSNRSTDESDDGSSVIGPLIGARRPRYDVLYDVIGDFVARQPIDEDLFIFVDLMSALRHFFSEYSTAQLTRGELNRHPRQLAAELLNIAGHYRNYVWKHHGRRSTVLMYHSTAKCPAKLAVSPDFKANVYAKRIGGAGPEYDVIRGYVAFNLRIAKQIAERIPHVHVIDTGETDPEAWPWALAREGRVVGSALVLSSWAADYQYALGPGVDPMSGREWGVLRASGEHSRLVLRDGLVGEVLRKSKTGEEIASKLAPEHFLYMLALAGDDDLGAPGIPKFGMAKAAKHIAKCVAEGRLPPGSPSLEALLEDGRIPDGQAEAVERCWRLLVHDSYAPTVSQEAMAAIDAQMVNRSGIGELEKANAQYFGGALNLPLLFAGEEY
jgi:hypothetical protein